MSDLRKAAEMALEYFEDAYGLEDTEVAIKEALRQALAEPRKETFTLDRGCWERGCMAYDTRDCDEGTTIYVDAANMTPERVDETVKGRHEPVGGEWVPCVKLPVIVHVRNQRDGENHISTREGITPVLPEDLIMRGVAGEEYPIGRELFERTYTFDTAPPKKEWVGLSDEEKYDVLEGATGDGGRVYYDTLFRSYEAKLKEKNGG